MYLRCDTARKQEEGGRERGRRSSHILGTNILSIGNGSHKIPPPPPLPEITTTIHTTAFGLVLHCCLSSRNHFMLFEQRGEMMNLIENSPIFPQGKGAPRRDSAVAISGRFLKGGLQLFLRRWFKKFAAFLGTASIVQPRSPRLASGYAERLARRPVGWWKGFIWCGGPVPK